MIIEEAKDKKDGKGKNSVILDDVTLKSHFNCSMIWLELEPGK